MTADGGDFLVERLRDQDRATSPSTSRALSAEGLSEFADHSEPGCNLGPGYAAGYAVEQAAPLCSKQRSGRDL